MGNSSSKAARTAAGAAKRQYPSTSSIGTNPAQKSHPRPTNAPSQSAPTPSQAYPSSSRSPPSESKSEHVDLDGRDPQFGNRLSQIGPVQPVAQTPSNQSQFPPSASPNQQGRNIFPSSSPSTNPAIMVTQARERTNRLWEEESESLGRSSFQGRTLISAQQIREVLELKERGLATGEIEKRLRLRSGLVGKLGAGVIVGNA